LGATLDAGDARWAVAVTEGHADPERLAGNFLKSLNVTKCFHQEILHSLSSTDLEHVRNISNDGSKQNELRCSSDSVKCHVCHGQGNTWIGYIQTGWLS
jgi:hypothetical protein